MVLFCGTPIDIYEILAGKWDTAKLREHIASCPDCQRGVRMVSGLIGSYNSDAKRAAARENGKKGGRPRKSDHKG
jgi:hypothetical protein